MRALAVLLALAACAAPAAAINPDFEQVLQRISRDPAFQGREIVIIYEKDGFHLEGKLKISYAGVQERDLDLGKSMEDLLRFSTDLKPVARTLAERCNKPELRQLIDLVSEHRDLLEQVAKRLEGKKVRVAACTFRLDMWCTEVRGTPPSDLPSVLRELVERGEVHREYTLPYPEIHIYVLAGAKRLDGLIGLPVRLAWSYDYPAGGVEVLVDPVRREVTFRAGERTYNLVVVLLEYLGDVVKLLQRKIRSVREVLRILRETRLRILTRSVGGEVTVRGLPLWVNKGAVVVAYFAGTNPFNGVAASRAAAAVGSNPMVVKLGPADVRVEAHGRALTIEGAARGGLLVVYGMGIPGNRLQVSSTVSALDLAERLGVVRLPPIIGWLLRLILRPLAGTVTFCYAPSFQGKVTLEARGFPVWSVVALVGLWFTLRPRTRRGSAAA